MKIKLSFPEYSIETHQCFTSDIFKAGKEFPLVDIDVDSYIEEAFVETVLDEDCIYQIAIGKYSSLADGISLLVDMNHDYKKIAQGRIRGLTYRRPEYIPRKGQIIIGNDCWIGRGATILGGVTIGDGAVIGANSVVTKDVPPYAILAGNPGRIIGYRFTEQEILDLKTIGWWNWDREKILQYGDLIYGNQVAKFIQQFISEAKEEIEKIDKLDLKILPKEKEGSSSIYYYVPDFHSDYPTYPRVIKEFINEFADTNAELLIYVIEDENVEEKLSLLNQIFDQYQQVNAYINLYIGDIVDERSVFSQIDFYISSRENEAVHRIGLAEYYGVKTYFGVNKPIFAS